jgi:hypothetical protein
MAATSVPRVSVRRSAGGAAVALAAALTLTPIIASCPQTAIASVPETAVSTRLVSLLATQSAIMMNGTFTPDVTPEFAALVMHNYIEPLVGTGYTPYPLTTPEELWPLSGLFSMSYYDSTRVGYQILDAKYHEIAAKNTADGAPDTPLLVFGYSQSAFIASVFDQGLSDEMMAGKHVPPTNFFLVGNTNIPNGGLFSRFNGFGLTPWTPVIYAPTKTGSPTYDVFRQYDPFADFPAYPLNALAVVNSLMGYLLHFTLPVSGSPAWLTPVINILNKLITPISLNPDSPNYVKPIVSQYQDTTYQFVPTAKLPILDPLRWIGLSKLADDLDPVLRPLVEAGYDRSVSFGVPTPARFVIPPDLDAAFKQSWQALMHLLNPSLPAPSAATAVARPAAAIGGAAPAAIAVVDPVVAPALPVAESPASQQNSVTAPSADLGDSTPAPAIALQAPTSPVDTGATASAARVPAAIEAPVSPHRGPRRDALQAADVAAADPAPAAPHRTPVAAGAASRGGATPHASAAQSRAASVGR